MEHFILNKNGQRNTEYHKIHTKECTRRPKEENCIDLGMCICPIEAKNRAKEYYQNVNGCKYCCKEIYYKNSLHIQKGI